MLAHEGHLTKMSDHKVSDHKQVKIFTKKMLQRLKIAFSQIKVGNNSKINKYNQSNHVKVTKKSI